MLEERKIAARKFITELMVLTAEEKEYLNLFEVGDFRPELLFSNDKILENIAEHPMAIWKVCSQEKIEMKF